MGTFYIVSTPIGNLEDLSVRGARILGEVEAVYAEDTRRSSILLRHLGLSTPLLSLHAHNEESRAEEVLGRLEAGGEIALVSDAGTPLLSDPGERIVRRVLEGGHTIVPIPGPSAILHALVGSGLPAVPFTFLGFLPRKGRERGETLERIAHAGETVVLFESPERLGKLLEELEGICGPDRGVAVGRELTKLHEEFRRGTLTELARYYREGEKPRGEVTLVLAPALVGGEGEAVDVEAGRLLAAAILRGGSPPSRAARDLARRLGIPRNRAYALVQEVVGGEAGRGGDASDEPLEEGEEADR